MTLKRFFWLHLFQQNFWNKCKRVIKGFGLVEVMVVTSVLGVISMSVMTIVNNANKATLKMDVGTLKNELLTKARILLSDKDSCERTLVTPAVNAAAVNLGGLLNAAGTNVIPVQLAAAATVKRPVVSRISFVRTAPSGTGAYEPVNVNLDISEAINNSGVVTVSTNVKTIGILATFNAGGVFTSCYADRDASVNTANQKICTDLKGIWVPSGTISGTCNLRTKVQVDAAPLADGATTAASVQYVKDYLAVTDVNYIKRNAGSPDNPQTTVYNIQGPGFNTTGGASMSGTTITTPGNITTTGAGNITAAATLTGANMTVTNNLTVGNNIIHRGWTYSEELATKTYVTANLIENLPLATRESIINAILAYSNSTGPQALRRAILGNAAYSETRTCPAGQYVNSVTYNSFSDGSRLTVGCAAPTCPTAKIRFVCDGVHNFYNDGDGDHNGSWIRRTVTNNHWFGWGAIPGQHEPIWGWPHGNSGSGYEYCESVTDGRVPWCATTSGTNRIFYRYGSCYRTKDGSNDGGYNYGQCCWAEAYN
jgi:prepilin-type N-terminal cleavage/methylation domain-containing protein